MKIVLLGSHGQLGIDCFSVLSRDHEVIGFSRQQADISNKKTIDDLITHHKPQLLINCAAFTAVDKCETETELAWQVNCNGPRHLAQLAGSLDIRLIHISTDYVFDGKKKVPHPYTEHDPVSPVSEYGKSKLAGEEAVQKHCKSHLILRTAWLYSANGPNFLKTMLRLALQNGDKEIQVVDDQYGSLTWSYTLALQIKTLLETDMIGIVHTTAEGYSTWYEAACYFLEKMDIPHNLFPCTTAQYPTPAKRPTNSILENNRLKQASINLFQNWQKDIDQFVAQHKEDLLAKISAQ